MAKFILLFLIFLIHCKDSGMGNMILKGEVLSQDGLRIRKEDSVDSEKIGFLVFQEEVTVLDENGKDDFQHEKSGKWMKVKSKDGITGWVFGPFLKIKKVEIKNQEIVLTETEISSAKEIYDINCATCHGEKGLGDGPGSMSLNPKPRNFTSPSNEYKYGKDIPSIIQVIKKGSPETAMFSYSHLGDENIELLAKYIYSKF